MGLIPPFWLKPTISNYCRLKYHKKLFTLNLLQHQIPWYLQSLTIIYIFFYTILCKCFKFHVYTPKIKEYTPITQIIQNIFSHLNLSCFLVNLSSFPVNSLANTIFVWLWQKVAKSPSQLSFLPQWLIKRSERWKLQGKWITKSRWTMGTPQHLYWSEKRETDISFLSRANWNNTIWHNNKLAYLRTGLLTMALL